MTKQNLTKQNSILGRSMQRNLAERIDCHDNLLNISNFYRSLFWGQNFGIHDQGLNLEETKSMSKTLQHTVMLLILSLKETK